MRALTATELLQIWENSFDLSPVERSLQLLTHACSLPNRNLAGEWSIGQRDARLFQLRAWMFGDHFFNVANCPRCNEQVEWEMNFSDFIPQFPPLEQEFETLRLEVDGYHINFRLPNSNDLMAVINRKLAPEALLAKCILAVENDQKKSTIAELPTFVLEQLSDKMSEADPLSNITMLLDCPDCQHQWKLSFDIMQYLWEEVDVWAKRILQEVYTLARAFGWAEKDILEMPPRRRQFYLQMIGT